MRTVQFELHFGSIPLGDAIPFGNAPDSSYVTINRSLQQLDCDRSAPLS